MTVCQLRKSASNVAGNKLTPGFTYKVGNFEVPSAGSMSNENPNDPLLIHSCSSSHFMTQYITLQHGAGDASYDLRDGSSSLV